MPLLPAKYTPPFYFKSGHLSTIYHGLFRRVHGLEQQRERVELWDGDFIDLDWSYSESPTGKVVILLHGLEGNGQRPYITGSAKAFNEAGYDACAVNFRGCSGETNRLFRSYHSGATEDLHAVVQHILEHKKYSELYLKGFSLGGNMAMKYLGEGRSLPPQVKGAVGVSVPCDLHDSLTRLLSTENYLYARRFRKHLVQKLKEKQKNFPDKLPDGLLNKIRTLKDFDDLYTSKAHGFKDALDYYDQCSALQFLPQIQIPSLIINARDDSFLGKSCYPFEIADLNSCLYLETPIYGGHVGFYGEQNITYSEKRAINFFEDLS
ncbi:alpha/beta fold hydrolase [Zeaxanthinibacter sp. PT1]|uniref:YheT family hydrolase n=1 Tax=Zeaxanthinibacter TaxID=561554 RepID=UPI00234B7AFC|nr:alpha/beta fold hydrolase [Zeaxanthinibacter sp. PT1]MDC6350989.1 alpha/beta fold hydrolase [Zeaxanthinibacter sp. PT1]